MTDPEPKRRMPRRRLAQALIATGVTASAFAAAAQSAYPARPIRVVLPFGAGGVADITVRIVSERMAEKLGQRFVIENVPGAGGSLAAQRVLQAPADGYTLALLTNGTAISVPLFRDLGFDPVGQFAPISTMGLFDFVLATGAATELRSLADLIRVARQKPGSLNVGTIIVGSTQHLSALLFASAAGIEVEQVQYRNTPDALVALLRNDVQLVIDSYASLKASIADGRVRALAISGAARSELLPDVPTVAEQGVTGFDVTSWNALFARAGTPPEAIAALNASMATILAEPDTRKRLLELGIEARHSTPDGLAARLRSDIARWAGVIEKGGVPRQ